jgi:hypothetical protein
MKDAIKEHIVTYENGEYDFPSGCNKQPLILLRKWLLIPHSHRMSSPSLDIATNPRSKAQVEMTFSQLHHNPSTKETSQLPLHLYKRCGTIHVPLKSPAINVGTRNIQEVPKRISRRYHF